MIRSGLRLTNTLALLPLTSFQAPPRAHGAVVHLCKVLHIVTLTLAGVATLAPNPARAQAAPPADAEGAVATAPETATAEPSAQQRQAAAEAYDRGTAAFLSRDYVAAARWFETAHRMAPAAPALLQAVRANQRADNTLRASNLALRLQLQYQGDRQAARVAAPIVTAASRAFVRVDVACEGCTVDLDGTLQDFPSFYLEPNSDHLVGAHFGTGDAEAQRVTGAAGEQRALRFIAPPPPPPVVPETTHGWPATALRHGDDANGAAGGGATGHSRRPPAEPSGISPIVFIVSAVATAGAGGVLVWSGLDTMTGVGPYEANPTQAALEAGQKKELRTNILIAATSVLCATTLLFALLTNWGGSGERAPADAPVRADVAPVAGGAIGILRGSF